MNGKMTLTMFLLMFSCVISATEIFPVIGGKVSDSETGESLPYAIIKIKHTNRITTANQDGMFVLVDVPSGSTITVSKIGFESQSVQIESDAKKVAIELFKLGRASDNSIENITVTIPPTLKLEQSSISQYSLTSDIPKPLPNLGKQDIFSTMQLLSDVSGSNESSSWLGVWGSSVQNLVLFDGNSVNHIEHVFGGLSAFNTNAIKGVQLSKGGFGAMYGGSSSSVINIMGKDGSIEKLNIGGTVGLLSDDAVIETPFADAVGSLILTSWGAYPSALYDDMLGSVKGQRQNNLAGSPTLVQFDLASTMNWES